VPGHSNMNLRGIDIQVNDRAFPAADRNVTETDALVGEIMMHLLLNVMAYDFFPALYRCVSYTFIKLPPAAASVSSVSSVKKESPTTVRDYIECLVQLLAAGPCHGAPSNTFD
jgi:hypothetical protein